MAVIKFNKEHRDPYMFENDAYRIEYQTSSTDSAEYKYSVYDKKQECNMRLEFSQDDDKALCLSLYRDGQKPLHLKAKEPYFRKLWPIGDECGRSQAAVSVDSSRSVPQTFEGLMQVYRALDKGDFIINSKMMPVNGDRNVEKQRDVACKAACEVLNFMDEYIFNTPESKELLNEHLNSQMEYTSVRNKKSASNSGFDSRFIAEIRSYNR